MSITLLLKDNISPWVKSPQPQLNTFCPERVAPKAAPVTSRPLFPEAPETPATAVP